MSLKEYTLTEVITQEFFSLFCDNSISFLPQDFFALQQDFFLTVRKKIVPRKKFLR